ncbi:MAG TPA: ABC transporter substrate-binding protein [Streptosporangiaceae bacterium]|jgi:peptide/nickel transport system substrate-binding protein|nr:ABC transporter substrate-binding protein [Streptosporangiaceae bacterium]
MFHRRRKIGVAGVAAVAATALLAAGCGSSSGNSGTSSGATVKGAVATLANINGAGANCIFPFQGTQCYSVTNYEDFMYLMVRPLYMFGGNSATSIAVDYKDSPASAPVYSDGGKTVVINLKGWKWSNGETVNAKDLIFFLNMLEAEKTNYAGYTPTLLPDNMTSYSATGPDQVTLHLKTGYSSIWFTYNQLAILTPMPQAWDVSSTGGAAGSGGCTTDSAADGWAKCKAVYTYMTAQNKDTATYATNPLWQVVDGPFKLTAYNVNGNYTFVPNTKYSGPQKASIAELKFATYTSDTAIYTGLKTGALSVGPIPSTDLPPAGKGYLPTSNPLASAGYSLQAALSFTTGFAYTNFNNPTAGPAFKQLYFRQAMQMLNNEKGMDTAVGRGYSAPTTSGVPTLPPSQWTSSAMTENGGQGPYPYDPSKAEALLASHGWKVVGGVLTCESAGSGASNCGPGVAKGTQAKFTMAYTSGISTQEDNVDILKSGFGQAGIQLTPQGETFDSLLADTVPCKPTQSSCKWDFLYLGGWSFNGPGFEPTGEPLYSTGAPNNSGSYSDPTMDKLINETHTSSSLSVFHTYANYTATQLPALWFPWPVNTEAVSNNLHNVVQNPLDMFTPEYWTCSSKTC